MRDYTQPPSLADPIARMPRQGQNMRLGKELGIDADVDAESVCVPVSVREQEGRPRRRGRRTSKTSKRKSKRRLYGRSFSQDRDRDALQVLWKMCQRRASGVPLQYILGDQPFGDLEILCQRGVLIPRYVSFLLFSFIDIGVCLVLSYGGDGDVFGFYFFIV